jgi:hypothetical protein
VNRFYFVSTGEWSVLHGGILRSTNYHHPSRTQRWAYDLTVRRSGLQHPPGDKRNEAFFCHGMPVLAPAPGVIVTAIDGVAENRPGSSGTGGGNGVVIDHGFGERSELWHGIPGTLRVRKGDRVVPGQELFRVGNSGRSGGPHIHFHVTSSGRDSMALPVDFSDVWHNGAWRERAMPVRGDTVRGVPLERRAAAPTVLLDL